MFEYLYQLLASVHPLLPIFVFYAMFGLYIFLLPGKTSVKLGLFYLTMVSLPELFFQLQWLYVVIAVAGGIALGLSIFRLFSA